MEAARVAALRGHRVTLLEKRRRLGGSLTLAATVHSDNGRFLDFLRGQMSRLKIEIRLGVTATPELIRRLEPDEVIVATGARLELPVIPGSDLPHVLTGADFRKLANGEAPGTAAVPAWARLGVSAFGSIIDRQVTPERIRKLADRWLPVGRRVVLVGADLAAIELAEFLAKRGRDVTLLTAHEEIAPEIGPKRRLEHEHRLERLKVSINSFAAVSKISPDTVEILFAHGKRTCVAADSVIIAGNPVADTGLHDELLAGGISSHAIGDCTGLGLIVKAVFEGASVANAL
jgi:2,4-dienoyl-CoA reductase (NADPH2)